MDETSPCDVCGSPVPVPARQHVGWCEGHHFSTARDGLLELREVRCPQHPHWTDPAFSRVQDQPEKPKPRKPPSSFRKP